MKKNTQKIEQPFDYAETVYIEDWGGDSITVALTNNVKAAIKFNCEKLGIKSKKYVPKGSVGACWVWVKEKGIERYWMVFDIEQYEPRIAVHESVHASAAILYNKGVPLKSASEEAYAYLTDRIFTLSSEVVSRGLVEFKKQQKCKNSKKP